MLSLLFALAQAPQDPILWSSDSRLTKAITVRADALPVEDFVAAIGKETETVLTAAPEVGERRVIAFAAATPASEVMQKLADHFDASWRTSREGYELYQTPKRKKQEADELREFWLKPLRRWRQASAKRLREPAPNWEQSKKRIAQIMADELVHMGRYTEEYTHGDEKVRAAWVQRHEEIKASLEAEGRRQSSVHRMVDALVANLPDDELLDLEDLPYLVYASHPTQMQRPLPPAAMNALNALFAQAAFVEVAKAKFNDDDRELLNRMAFEGIGGLKEEDIANVRVKIGLSEDTRWERTKIDVVDVELVLRRAPWITTQRLSSSIPMEPGYQPMGSREPEMPEPENPVLDRPFTLSQEILDRLAADRQRRIDPGYVIWQKGEPRFPAWWVARDMNDGAALTGFNFIADGAPDRSLGRFNIKDDTVRKMVKTFALARQADVEVQGNWVAFKSFHRPLERAIEIPSSTFRRWRDFMEVPFNLNNRARGFAMLTPIQRAFTPNYMYGRATNTLFVFWDSLGPSQRQALLQGIPLRGSSLTPRSKELLYEYFMLTSTPVANNGTQPDPVLDAEELAWKRELGWFDPAPEGDREVTQILPRGIPDDLEIHMRRFEQDATFADFAGVRRLGMPLRDTIDRWEGNAKRDVAFGLTTEEKNFVLFRAPGGFLRGRALSGFGAPTGPIYMSYDSLPERIRQKVEATLKAREGK